MIARAAGGIGISRLPLSQVGIQFIQVGDNPDTSKALEILDNELEPIRKIRVSLSCSLAYWNFISFGVGYGRYCPIFRIFDSRTYYKDRFGKHQQAN